MNHVPIIYDDICIDTRAANCGTMARATDHGNRQPSVDRFYRLRLPVHVCAAKLCVAVCVVPVAGSMQSVRFCGV